MSLLSAGAPTSVLLVLTDASASAFASASASAAAAEAMIGQWCPCGGSIRCAVTMMSIYEYFLVWKVGLVEL